MIVPRVHGLRRTLTQDALTLIPSQHDLAFLFAACMSSVEACTVAAIALENNVKHDGHRYKHAGLMDIAAAEHT